MSAAVNHTYLPLLSLGHVTTSLGMVLLVRGAALGGAAELSPGRGADFHSTSSAVVLRPRWKHGCQFWFCSPLLLSYCGFICISQLVNDEYLLIGHLDGLLTILVASFEKTLINSFPLFCSYLASK